MYDAFISYSRADVSTVEGLKRQLDDHHLNVFLDLDSLRAGQDWPPQLGAAVQNSRLVVLCWSAQAAASDWVRAEIHHSLSTKKPVRVLPWLLDGTPLPPMLQQKHGIQGIDPDPVVEVIADERRRHNRRKLAALGAGAVLLAPAVWLSPRVLTRQNMAFRGHVVDQDGNAITDAAIESDGVRDRTNTSGEFTLVLPGPPAGRALRVTASKPGYRKRTIDTQSDVPDLGIILEKDQ
jgi:hypothetical protein